jgi:hypothetical protein
MQDPVHIGCTRPGDGRLRGPRVPPRRRRRGRCGPGSWPLGPGARAALKSGLVSGFIAGLTIVFISMLNGPVDTVRAVSPETVLSQDREIALVTALLTGVDLGVIAGVAAGPWIGLAVSIPGGMTMGLGMSSWGRARALLLAGCRRPDSRRPSVDLRGYPRRLARGSVIGPAPLRISRRPCMPRRADDLCSPLHATELTTLPAGSVSVGIKSPVVVRVLAGCSWETAAGAAVIAGTRWVLRPAACVAPAAAG